MDGGALVCAIVAHGVFSIISPSSRRFFFKLLHDFLRFFAVFFVLGNTFIKIQRNSYITVFKVLQPQWRKGVLRIPNICRRLAAHMAHRPRGQLSTAYCNRLVICNVDSTVMAKRAFCTSGTCSLFTKKEKEKEKENRINQ